MPEVQTESEKDRRHRLLHTLWTKAVGTKDYDKGEWRELERILLRIDTHVAANTHSTVGQLTYAYNTIQTARKTEREVAESVIATLREQIGILTTALELIRDLPPTAPPIEEIVKCALYDSELKGSSIC